MTPEAFADFSICLQYLSPGNAPPWDAGCARFYFATLACVPDADVPPLMRAVGTEFQYRPAPQQVLELWRRASRPAGKASDEIVAELLALRDRYGEYVVPDPAFPRILHAGEPQWTDPIKRRVVAAMGGWVTFCRDEGLGAAQRAHLAKFAASALAGESDGAIERLRLEYQEARREALAALPAPPTDDGMPHGSPLLDDQVPDYERGGRDVGMVRLGSIGSISKGAVNGKTF